MSNAMIELKNIPPILFHQSSTMLENQLYFHIEARCGDFFIQSLIPETVIITAKHYYIDEIKNEQFRMACRLVKMQIYDMETRQEE